MQYTSFQRAYMGHVIKYQETNILEGLWPLYVTRMTFIVGGINGCLEQLAKCHKNLSRVT